MRDLESAVRALVAMVRRGNVQIHGDEAGLAAWDHLDALLDGRAPSSPAPESAGPLCLCSADAWVVGKCSCRCCGAKVGEPCRHAAAPAPRPPAPGAEPDLGPDPTLPPCGVCGHAAWQHGPKRCFACAECPGHALVHLQGKDTPEVRDVVAAAARHLGAPAPRPEETRPFCSATLGAFRCEKREGHDGQHFAWADGQTHRWGARPEETPDGR